MCYDNIDIQGEKFNKKAYLLFLWRVFRGNLFAVLVEGVEPLLVVAADERLAVYRHYVANIWSIERFVFCAFHRPKIVPVTIATYPIVATPANHLATVTHIFGAQLVVCVVIDVYPRVSLLDVTDILSTDGQADAAE